MADGHLLFVWKTSGYELREQDGDVPAVGSEIETDGQTLLVTKVGPPRQAALRVRRPLGREVFRSGKTEHEGLRETARVPAGCNAARVDACRIQPVDPFPVRVEHAGVRVHA